MGKIYAHRETCLLVEVGIDNPDTDADGVVSLPISKISRVW